jgi:hypothetical protein
MRWSVELEKCALGRCSGAQRSDAGRENAGVRGGDRQLSCSSSGGDADAETAVQVPACSAFGFALAFDVLQLPSRHSFVSGWSDDTEAHRYYGQKEGTTIL